MPILNDHDVWIESDGQRYEEYDTKVEGDIVTCYIASQAEKTFKICWKLQNHYIGKSIGLNYNLDGVKLWRAANHKLDTRELSLKGLQLNCHSFIPFMFSDGKLSDDGGSSSVSNNFGTISVEIKHVRIESQAPVHIAYDSMSWLENLGIPRNKCSKKIGTHRIVLSDNSQRDKVAEYKYYTLPYLRGPNTLATFQFKYRPKDILRDLGVIPTSQPEDSEEDKRTCSPSSSLTTEPAIQIVPASQPDEYRQGHSPSPSLDVGPAKEVRSPSSSLTTEPAIRIAPASPPEGDQHVRSHSPSLAAGPALGAKRIHSPSPSPPPAAGPSSTQRDERIKKPKVQMTKVKVDAGAIDLSDEDQTERELEAQRDDIDYRIKQLRLEQELLARRSDIDHQLKQLRKRRANGMKPRVKNNEGHSVDLSQVIDLTSLPY